jgi:alcohol dehydrogenase class IV
MSASEREQSTRPSEFTWRDGGRTILFRRSALEDAAGLLGEHGFERFTLLSTARALSEGGRLAAAAAAVHEVPAGAVPDTSAQLLDGTADAERLVALGGGRVIDTAKAIAALSGAEVAAVPTTMSGAEMTAIHRLPAGREGESRGPVRPALVLADPGLMTSQPEEELRASSMNALAHGADSLYTPFANPVSRICALRGAELIAAALDQPPDTRDRSSLALGSLLCGYAIDSGEFALHHVICQTLVRVCGSPHAETNASVLPESMRAMRERAPVEIAQLAEAVGAVAATLPERLKELGRPPGLGPSGADAGRLEEALDAIEARPQLAHTPNPPGREELRRIIEAAW